ncbi:MAG: diguanylate cyclase, partial [Acidobacteriota bacterium]
EKSKLRTYPKIGAEILEEVGFPYPVVPIVRHHAEQWNGGGMPDGLSGTEIPLGARILAVADSVDAMLYPRPYHEARSREDVIDQLRRDAGRRLDPQLVEVFIEHLDELIDRARAADHPRSSGVEQIARVQRDYALELFAGQQADHALDHIAAVRREAMAIHEFARDLGRSLGIEQTLSNILEKLENLVSFDTGVIYLHDGAQALLRAAFVHGRAADKLKGKVLMQGEGVTGWAVDNGRTLVNVLAKPDFCGPRADIGRSFRSAMVVPLVIEGRSFGALTFYDRREKHFSLEDERILELIAPEAAAAIYNARAYETSKASAMTDSLTGLPNLRFLFAQLEKEVLRARRFRRPFGVAVFDLDRFKAVNDTYGHQVGDEVLRAVGHFLQDQLRAADTICRWGGDEFVALLPDADPQLIESAVSRVQQRIEQRPIPTSIGQHVRIGISVGWAVFPDDGSDFEELMRRADQRMYQDKAQRHDMGLGDPVLALTESPSESD